MFPLFFSLLPSLGPLFDWARFDCVFTRIAPGLTRSDLLDAIIDDVDVFMRLQEADPSTYIDKVKDYA